MKSGTKNNVIQQDAPLQYFRKEGKKIKKKNKPNFVHMHACVYVFTVPFIAKVDLPVLYKAVS